jgi:hypothetical protein
MNRNLYPTIDDDNDDDMSVENVSSVNVEEEEIPVLEEEEPEIPILPNVPTGQAPSSNVNKTKSIIKLPISAEEKREFALIKNKKQILNEQIEVSKENFKAFISKYKALTGKKLSDLSKEKKEEIFGKSIALQKDLEDKLKKVETQEEEFKRKYKERRTRGGRRHRHHRHHRRGLHVTFKRLFLKKGITKKRSITKNKKRSISKNKKRSISKNKRNTKKY